MGSVVYNANKGKRERVTKLLLMHADSRTELDEVYAGDIAAFVGLRETVTGETLCSEGKPLLMESMDFPEPVIRIAIESKTKAGQQKLSDALAKLAEEDPTFRSYSDEETGQTILAGMGELHLDIIVDRLIREFKVECRVGKPQVAYRESITKPFAPSAAISDRMRARVFTATVPLSLRPARPAAGLCSKTPFRLPCFRLNTLRLLKKAFARHRAAVRWADTKSLIFPQSLLTAA